MHAQGRLAGRSLVAASLISLAAAARPRAAARPSPVELYGETPLPDPARLRHAVQGAAAPPTQTLRAAAAARGVLAGAESAIYYLTSTDLRYAPTLFAQYDLTEPENECKPDWVSPVRGVFDTANCSFTIAQMRAHGGQARACCLVWGAMAQPPWLAHGTWNASTLGPVMAELIGGIMGAEGVRGQVLAWDVVNEPVCDNGHCPADNSSVFKPNTWWPTLGDGYVEAALRLARAADPAAQLFINEYGAEDLGAKSDRVYALVSGLVARGVPLDGVGLQMHMSINGYPNATQVEANIRRLGALGLKVHITEMDCECPPKYCNNSTDGLARQAVIFGDMLQACLNNPGVCTSFSTWGFTDLYSWTNGWCGPVGNQTHDCQALPFDTQYAPKPAMLEMLAVLQQHAPAAQPAPAAPAAAFEAEPASPPAAAQASHAPSTAPADAAKVAPKPHIIFMMIDDFGHNNIGYHAKTNAASAEIKTPVMDALAAEGVTLDRHYVFRFCSPTRSALLTGRNPIHVNVLNSDLAAANVSDPISGFAGIPRNMSTMASRLREAGYRTVAAGKWHVGLATRDHLPIGRGFEQSLVYLDGANGYWNDCCTGWCSPPSDPYEPTTDLWLNDGPAYKMNASWACTQATQGANCTYEDALLTDFATEAIEAHDPSEPLFLYFAPHAVHVSAMGLQLEVPDAQLAQFAYICSGDNSSGCSFRMKYAAITNLVDSYIGRVVDALKAKGMWSNTLLVLSADNGGLTIADGFGGANNFPLRGGKISNWEGGIRANALASGGFIPPARRGALESSFIEVADWLATFCTLAGIDPHDAPAAAVGLPPIDSLDMSALLLGTNATSPRREVWIGVDTDDGNDGATLVQGIISAADGFKLLVGSVPEAIWQGPLFPNATTKEPAHDALDCGNVTHPLCLFNVLADPTEHDNVISQHPDVAAALAARVAALQRTVFSPLRGPSLADRACNNSAAVWGGFVGPFLR